nr:translation initiation factor IF-2-like [Symphalangus syndactylus]
MRSRCPDLTPALAALRRARASRPRLRSPWTAPEVPARPAPRPPNWSRADRTPDPVPASPASGSRLRPAGERLVDSPGPHGRPSPHTTRRLSRFRSRTRPLPPRLSPGPAWAAGQDRSPGAHGCEEGAGASCCRCQWSLSRRRRHRLIAAPPPPPPPTPLRALSSPRRRPRLCLSPTPGPRSRLRSAPRALRSQASGTGPAVCPSRRRPGVGKRRWQGQDGRAALRIPRGGDEFRLRRLRSRDTGRSRPGSGITKLGLGHSLPRFPPGGLARRRRRPHPRPELWGLRDPAGATPEPGPGSLGPRVLLPPGAAPAPLRPTRLAAASRHAVPRSGREAAGRSLGRRLAAEPARGPGGPTSPRRLCNPATGWGGRYAWFPEHPSPEAPRPQAFLGRNSVGSNAGRPSNKRTSFLTGEPQPRQLR